MLAAACDEQAALPACATAPLALWHAHAGQEDFTALARQPDGHLIGLHQHGWRRFRESDGADVGGWSSSDNIFTEGVAVAANGKFAVVGYQGGSAWSASSRPWVAIFSVDGKLAWSQVGDAAAAWMSVLGSGADFLLAGHVDPAGSRRAVIERRNDQGDVVWTRVLPTGAIDIGEPVSLAETATATVLVGGTRTVDSPDFRQRAVLIGIDAKGAADGGQLLLPSLSRMGQVGPLLPDGRLTLALKTENGTALVRTRLHAWSPAKLDDLGIETVVYQGPLMSGSGEATKALTLLPNHLAWLQYRWFQGGYQPNCGVANGQFAMWALGSKSPPITTWLHASPDCQSVRQGCTPEVDGVAMTAMPDGGFAIAGSAGNCAKGAGPGAMQVGWVARFLPLCSP